MESKESINCRDLRIKPAAMLLTATVAGLAMPLSAALGSNGVNPEMSQACEEALAVSSLPLRLRDRASVYVWKGDDFEKTISSEGGFHCAVQRNHPQAIIPVCFTAHGENSLLPAALYKTKLALNGTSAEEAERLFAAKLLSGEVRPASGPGINYMMSDFISIHTGQEPAFMKVPPHVMFFAPYLTNEDVGGLEVEAAMAQKGVPTVVADNPMHSYMVTFTEAPADRTEVEEKCAGQPFLMNRAANR